MNSKKRRWQNVAKKWTCGDKILFGRRREGFESGWETSGGLWSALLIEIASLRVVAAIQGLANQRLQWHTPMDGQPVPASEDETVSLVEQLMLEDRCVTFESFGIVRHLYQFWLSRRHLAQAAEMLEMKKLCLCSLCSQTSSVRSKEPLCWSLSRT